jgi:dipeptidase D
MTARSDNLAEAAMLKARILSALEPLPGARMELDEFPPWQPDGDTPLVAYVQECRRGIFSTPAELISVHAGIECGGLASKRPGLGVVSIGPDISEVHTIRERASVDSIDRVYSWLKAILCHADESGTTKG